MNDRKISISEQTYETISEIIIAYTLHKDSASIYDIAGNYQINRNAVSRANGFLIDIGVIQGGKGKEKRIITEKGERLGRALKYNTDDVENSWVELIEDSQFFHALLQKLANKRVFSLEQMVGAIFQLSDTPYTGNSRTGARAIVKILCIVGFISKTERKDEYIIGPNNLNSVLKKNYDAPAELLPFLEKFNNDHVDPSRCAFIMMRFGSSNFYDEVVDEVRSICAEYNIVALRADDKAYADDLLPNVRAYMHGCGLGIAIFDRVQTDQHNPNVSLEVGYMMALGKPVLLLKDSTMSQLPSDLIGRLYKTFDVQNLHESLKQVIKKWIKEKSLN